MSVKWKDAPEVLTVAEVAELMRVHPETVKRWIRDGELAGAKLHGTYRVSKEAVVRKLGGE
jgi:excisionase family DNA binding protein